MKKRFAIIDLGTNTFNLLIIDKSESGFEEIYNERVGVGLGLGGINQNKIAAPAMERALETLLDYKKKSEELNAEEIHAFGTSAVRNAENKAGFLNAVEDKTGIQVNVLTGYQEAELIYQGVKMGYRFDHPSLIMDIGGGSTEFIFAHAKGLIKAESFEIGAARIYQGFEFSDPFTNEDCKKIEAYLENGVGQFFDTINTKTLIGASGSFETFYSLVYDCDYPDEQFVEIEKNKLETFLDLIINSTLAEREKNDRIIPIRKIMAPIAAVKIRWIIRKLSIEKIIISPFALKEGVINILKPQKEIK